MRSKFSCHNRYFELLTILHNLGCQACDLACLALLFVSYLVGSVVFYGRPSHYQPLRAISGAAQLPVLPQRLLLKFLYRLVAARRSKEEHSKWASPYCQLTWNAVILILWKPSTMITTHGNSKVPPCQLWSWGWTEELVSKNLFLFLSKGSQPSYTLLCPSSVRRKNC